jgi:uncharacterized protein YkuJ
MLIPDIKEGGTPMKGSQLVAIIKRLEAMQDTDSTEVQTRRFEKNGEERGLVTYDPKTETFELEELADHQTFQFDNIDLVAMEIFDLLDDGTDVNED